MNALNVLGTSLLPCSYDPLTGFFRDGCCNTDDEDRGLHLVCARVTKAFLAFSLERGNDLVSPRPQHRFHGLKPGDRWCLCTSRWEEALEAGCAPLVVMDSTHAGVLKYLSLAQLEMHRFKDEAN